MNEFDFDKEVEELKKENETYELNSNNEISKTLLIYVNSKNKVFKLDKEGTISLKNPESKEIKGELLDFINKNLNDYKLTQDFLVIPNLTFFKKFKLFLKNLLKRTFLLIIFFFMAVPYTQKSNIDYTHNIIKSIFDDSISISEVMTQKEEKLENTIEVKNDKIKVEAEENAEEIKEKEIKVLDEDFIIDDNTNIEVLKSN